MKAIDVIKLNKEFLMRMKEMGIRLDDCQYVDLYNDYEEMKAKGFKITYIVTELSDIYNVSERKVYDLLKRLNMDCKIRALRKR